MYDCFMMAFAALSGVGAIFAVVVAIIIFIRQKKIALFDRRTQILNDFECFVYSTLPNWEWDGSMTLVTRYSENEIKALFDDSMVALQKEIVKAAESCNILIGDIDHAKQNGTCRNMTESELEEEKINIERSIREAFTAKRAVAYKKWLKL